MPMEARPDPVFSGTQSDLFIGRRFTADAGGSYSKTSQVCSIATRDVILLEWLARWLGPDLALHETAGETPVVLSDQLGWLSGACWTRSTGDWRSGASVSSLSLTLETGPIDPRYFLSARACSGILRRAKKRGKELPAALKAALVAAGSPDPSTTERMPGVPGGAPIG